MHGQAGTKLLEIIHWAAADQEDLRYDPLYSSIFGLGVIARRLPNGSFAQLKETMAVLQMTCRDRVAGAGDLDEEEKEKRELLRDNSISTLGKIVFFQSDGVIVTQQHAQELFGNMLPILADKDEAQDIHALVLEQVLAESPVVAANLDAVKACVGKLKEYLNAPKEDDILGKKGKELVVRAAEKLQV